MVSADAAALFRGLEVLTAAPEYPARLVGVFDVEHDVSVGEFQRLAHEAIDDVLACGRTPVVVGGTGLYLRAALSDLELPPPPAEGARRRWEEFYDEHGGSARARAAADARSRGRSARPPERPPPRRPRARACGGGLDACRRRPVERETRHPTLVFGLDVPDDVLEQRIRARAGSMLERGVVDEARAALARPLSRSARKVMGLADFARAPAGGGA